MDGYNVHCDITLSNFFGVPLVLMAAFPIRKSSINIFERLPKRYRCISL